MSFELPFCPSSGKKRFPSPTFARRHCRHVGNRFRVYRCPDCHGWHITRGTSGRRP